MFTSQKEKVLKVSENCVDGKQHCHDKDYTQWQARSDKSSLEG